MDRCKLRDTTEENSRRHGILQQLEPFALHVLYELVSLVHNTISVDNQNGSTESTSKDSSSPDVEKEQIVKDNPPLSEIDTVANILLAVEPLVLRNILLGMVVSIYFAYISKALNVIDISCLISISMRKFVSLNCILIMLH